MVVHSTPERDRRQADGGGSGGGGFCVGPKQGPKGLKYGGAPYLASLLRFNGGECLKYRRGGFRNSV